MKTSTHQPKQDKNSRNGYSSKLVAFYEGERDAAIPRDHEDTLSTLIYQEKLNPYYSRLFPYMLKG